MTEGTANFKITLFVRPELMPGWVREPLLAFHTELFGDGVTRDMLETFERQSETASMFIAHQNRELLGFKFGVKRAPGCYYSWSGGVLPEARGKGIGSALMKAQHEWVAAQGYTRIVTATTNKWREMIVLNVRNGFNVVGLSTEGGGEVRITLEKPLSVSAT